MKSENSTWEYTFTPCLFISSKKSLQNVNVFMFRVSEISPLIFLLQYLAHLSVKFKLDIIRKVCTYLNFSYLVMWKNVQALQRTVPMYHFYRQGQTACRVVEYSRDMSGVSRGEGG